MRTIGRWTAMAPLAAALAVGACPEPARVDANATSTHYASNSAMQTVMVLGTCGSALDCTATCATACRAAQRTLPGGRRAATEKSPIQKPRSAPERSGRRG